MTKFVKVSLYSPKLGDIEGVLKCFKRDPKDYQVPHCDPRTKKEFRGPHYEVDVNPLLEFFLDEETCMLFRYHSQLYGNRKERYNLMLKLVDGMHIEVGNDFVPYLCCPNLPESQLFSAIELWLVHQVVYKTYKLNIGFVEGYVRHASDDFEDWLYSGDFMCNVKDSTRELLRSLRSFFVQARNYYYESVADRDSFSLGDFVDSVIDTFDIDLVVEEDVK